MTDFHYVRIPGRDGGVAQVKGPAQGVELDVLLRDGPPPWRVTLELMAAVCEISGIAAMDEAVHGDIGPESVLVDERGHVSIVGYGTRRGRTRAPEGSPRGLATDRYGLGRVLYRLAAGEALPDTPRKDGRAHDDLVIEAILRVDVTGLPDAMQGDVQYILARLLEFDVDDRMPAEDAWRTLIAFADEAPGERLDRWATVAVEGGGDRRAADRAGASTIEGGTEFAGPEELGGAEASAGPLAAAVPQLGKAGKGASTAFWSKADLRAALEADDDDDDVARRPPPGGGTATSFWTPEQLAAMASGAADAPRPRRHGTAKVEEARPVAPAAIPMADEVPRAAPPVAVRPVQVVEVPDEPPPLTPRPTTARFTPTPAARPSVGEPRPSGSGGFLLAAIAAAILLIAALCLGALAVGGLVVGQRAGPAAAPDLLPPVPAPAIQEASPPAPPEPTAPTPVAAPPPVTPAAAAAPTPPPAPAVSPRPAPASVPRPAPVAAPRPAPAVSPPPAATPTNGPAQVSFRSGGRGQLKCVGNLFPFDGATTVVVEPYQLPATCLVEIDGKRGVFQIFGSGAVRCDVDGSTVRCDRNTVP